MTLARAPALWAARATSTVRVRELDVVWLSRRVLEEVGFVLTAHLPYAVNRPLDLGTADGMLTLAFAGLAACLTLGLVAALLATPVGLALRRARGLYVAALLAGLALPTYVFVYRQNGPALGAALALAAAPFVLLLLRPGWLRGLVRGAGAIVVAGALVCVGSGVALSLVRAERTAQPAPPPGAPNILLVSIDSLRADHLHCYGYERETSPHIDAIARQGALFRTAVSPTSWTLPAHVTLFTALPPEGHGVHDDDVRLSEEAVLLTEILWQRGYRTAGFAAGPYLDGAFGFSQGFDHYDDFSIVRASHGNSHRGVTSPRSIELVSRWLEGWDERGRARPFFVFLHLWDVHYDFEPPPPYDTLFDPDYTGDVTGLDFETGPQAHAGMDPRDLEHIVALYDGEIRHTDEHLGRLFRRMLELGVLDETLLVITSDHGDEFFEHGRKGHSKALYDESVRVPLIVRYPPRVPAGVVVERQVRLMDVGPTILSLAGIARPEGFGGSAGEARYAATDLVPLLERREAEPLPAFTSLLNAQLSLRTESAKLILGDGERSGPQVFDLRSDPGERTDLSARDAALREELERDLRAWRQHWSQQDAFAEPTDVDPEISEQLRQLGYAE